MSRWTVADIPDQTGRIAVVTGANAGLGEQIVLELARAGMRVVLACRNQSKADAATGRIRRIVPSAQLEVRELDLASLSSVSAFADSFGADYDRLDLLVNNAGLMAIDAATTVDGFEMQLGVNHLGHFALTNRLLPVLLATPGSRIASMSSVGHRAGRIDLDDLMFTRREYDRWAAYSQSKLANLLFVAELQRRLERAGVSTIAVAAHPGGANTDLGAEGSSRANQLIQAVVPILAQSPRRGALPMLRAVTDPTVRGGEFYGPRFLVAGRTPVLERPSRRAQDPETARQLWDASESLVSMRSPVG